MVQVVEPELNARGCAPSEHVRFVAPFLNVTVPGGGPPAPDTVAVNVMELLAPEVKAVDGFGVSVVVLGVDAAVNVMVMSQELKLIWLESTVSLTRYRVQLPLMVSPVKTPFVEFNVLVPFVCDGFRVPKPDITEA